MLFAGIDVGSLTAQAVLLEDGNVTLSKSIRVKPNPLDSARTVMGELLEENGLSWDDITYCVSTGYGRDKVQGEGLAQENVSEISCHGLGAYRWSRRSGRSSTSAGRTPRSSGSTRRASSSTS